MVPAAKLRQTSIFSSKGSRVTAYLFLFGQTFDQLPSLLSGPRQTLCVLNILSERVLPELARVTTDDVFDSFLHALTAADFVYELVLSC
jgi:hypothetical protein